MDCRGFMSSVVGLFLCRLGFLGWGGRLLRLAALLLLLLRLIAADWPADIVQRLLKGGGPDMANSLAAGDFFQFETIGRQNRRVSFFGFRDGVANHLFHLVRGGIANLNPALAGAIRNFACRSARKNDGHRKGFLAYECRKSAQKRYLVIGS